MIRRIKILESGNYVLYSGNSCCNLVSTYRTKNHRYTREAQNLHHSYPSMGLKFGVFGFSRNQNNHGSSGAYVTCIYCSSLRVKMTCVKWNAAWRLKIHLFCIWSCMCGRQKPRRPTIWAPCLTNAFTGDDIWEIGSLLYICEKVTRHFAPCKFRLLTF